MAVEGYTEISHCAVEHLKQNLFVGDIITYRWHGADYEAAVIRIDNHAAQPIWVTGNKSQDGDARQLEQLSAHDCGSEESKEKMLACYGNIRILWISPTAIQVIQGTYDGDLNRLVKELELDLK